MKHLRPVSLGKAETNEMSPVMEEMMQLWIMMMTMIFSIFFSTGGGQNSQEK